MLFVVYDVYSSKMNQIAPNFKNFEDIVAITFFFVKFIKRKEIFISVKLILVYVST